jgi:hypothetical protein
VAGGVAGGVAGIDGLHGLAVDGLRRNRSTPTAAPSMPRSHGRPVVGGGRTPGLARGVLGGSGGVGPSSGGGSCGYG